MRRRIDGLAAPSGDPQDIGVVSSGEPACRREERNLMALSLLRCIECGHTHQLDDPVYVCGKCGGLLDVEHDFERLKPQISRELFDERLGALDQPYNSGVWRYKELVFPEAPDDMIVTRGEGNTNLYRAPKKLAAWIGAE